MNCQKCKHKQEAHGKSSAYPIMPLCFDCFGGYLSATYADAYHKFEWDNLDLIEHLAKERNLI